jgi:succinyl-CoA synthetase alpha subunit
MRLIGPNCLGVMNPVRGLNATFAHTIARPGNVAFISQSGALLTAILDWSVRESVGFSSFVSTGSMLDVSWGDLIDYFGSDPRTHSIVIYGVDGRCQRLRRHASFAEQADHRDQGGRTAQRRRRPAQDHHRQRRVLRRHSAVAACCVNSIADIFFD